LSKKILTIILLSIIIIVVFIVIILYIVTIENITDIKNRDIVYQKDLSMSSKQGVSLAYNEDIANINYIEIHDKGRFGLQIVNGRSIFRIDDREKIEKIIDYINSLELVEDEKVIYNFNYKTDLNSLGYFTIFIQKDNLEYTLIEFMTHYLTLVPSDTCDCNSTSYYIKDSGYDPITKNSKTFEFLYDLIHK